MAPVWDCEAARDCAVTPVLMARTGLPMASARPADAFDEQHDLARVRIVDGEVEVVGKAEIGLVARRDAIGVAQPPVGRGLHPELDQAAGLEDAGDRTGRKPAQI